jgi:hypothetical protein
LRDRLEDIFQILQSLVLREHLALGIEIHVVALLDLVELVLDLLLDLLISDMARSRIDDDRRELRSTISPTMATQRSVLSFKSNRSK